VASAPLYDAAVSSAQIELRPEAQPFEGREPALWRSHSDAVNQRFLDRHLAGRSFSSALKTDLFDESVTEGVIPLLRERAEEVIGIDLLPEVVSAAADRYPGLPVAPGDVRALDFEDARFDLVVSLSTLDHLESTDEITTAVRELARVLVPGGTLVLTLDNPVNPVIALRQALPSQRLRSAGLVAYPVGPTVSPRRLATMAARAGLTVRSREALMHAPRVVAIALARRIETEPAARTFRRRAMRMEGLGGWPTKYLTGHFSAIIAERAAD